MDDSDKFITLKRGRPRKLTRSEYEKTISWLKKEESAADLLFKHHKTEYINHFFTQRVRNMIREILRLLQLPLEYKVLPLQQITEETVKQMMLSEIELAGFAQIFLNQNLEKLDYPLEELIKIIAFSTKSKFESSSEILCKLESQLLFEVSDFIIKLKKVENDCEVDIKSISKMYRRLRSTILPVFNYSYYVDEILRVSPPYKLKIRTQKNPPGKTPYIHESKIVEEEAKKNDSNPEAAEIRPEEKSLDQSKQAKKNFSEKKSSIEDEASIRKRMKKEAKLWFNCQYNEYGLGKIDS